MGIRTRFIASFPFHVRMVVWTVHFRLVQLALILTIPLWNIAPRATKPLVLHAAHKFDIGAIHSHPLTKDSSHDYS